jgi:Zn-dependent membrane protease YugP
MSEHRLVAVFARVFSRLYLIAGILFLVYGMISVTAIFLICLFACVVLFLIAMSLERDANSIKRDVEEAKRIKLRQRQVNRLKQDVEEKETMKMREA